MVKIPGGTIQTVLGGICPEELGFCHCHDHLFIAPGRPREVIPTLYMDSVELTMDEVTRYRGAGGRSLVDAQPVGCCRMPEALVAVSERTGVHIVASTGFHKLVFYPPDHWIHTASESDLTRLFECELSCGMYRDGDRGWPTTQMRACAGIIKAAIDSAGPAGDYCRVLSAAATASLDTGFPLLCHTEKGSRALELIQFLMGKGVKPSSIIVCHLDREVQNLSYHKEVASAGVYLEYDTIGRSKYHSDQEEADLILSMLEEGFEDRILLGLDTTRGRLKSYGGDVGLDYLITRFIPYLEERGIPQEAIHRITVTNPARALARQHGGGM